MFKRIDHIEIIPSNFETSLAFYSDILGFEAGERHEVNIPPLKEIVYLSLGDTTLELMRVDNPADPFTEDWQSGYRMMAIEVDNMDEAINFLNNKGVAITWGPMDLGGPKRAEIVDPDGLGIELRQW